MRYLDMLTRLGIGSAHPGGFAATLTQFERYPLPAGGRILEVGCGTGRTACYLARLGYRVTGLDLRSEMLGKAAKRSAAEQLDIEWVEGSITALPFAADSFDVILAESVTNFAPIPDALGEYYRVLRAGGKLYDREVIALPHMPEPSRQDLSEFFGFDRLYTEDGWLEALAATRFARYEILERSLFDEHLGEDQIKHPDLQQITDGSAFLDPALWEISLRHDELIQQHQTELGYALICAVKG
ncbi:Methyltransferase domain-containing protein [Paenibacillus sp. UNCCL117]|uniref:class I SAM-dependent methyltransferase n=1 Tax=unclassified Paenibacillus TaxID=185978 RepID=UPI00088CBE6B|nr:MULTISPECIES: class I SAM-dependent methyltransferase [unclassified Paenibacillus]SDE36781.1 Methyltransferase domain-containing protein [Paenibacillus sp. cl123]SFW64817.1 Methyltransferase domain-containing protein [Paenibacillus sp. UNCCL117]